MISGSSYLGFSQSVSGFLVNLTFFLNYGFALLGGIIADAYIGQFKNNVIGLILITIDVFEHIHLTKVLSFVGVGLIIFGNGIMKPSTSAFLGDQFLPHQDKLRTQYFSWYYLSINIGSIVSSLGAPVVLQQLPSWILFAILTGVMVITVPAFIIPTNSYRKVKPPANVFLEFLKYLVGAKLRPDTNVDDFRVSLKVLKIFIPLPLFWAIFFQMYSMWVFEAQQMDRDITVAGRTFTVPASEVVALNPILDCALIPLFAKVVYPLLAKIGLPLTDLKKMGLGLLCTAAAILVAGFVQLTLEKQVVTVYWIIPQFFLVSCGEILLSVTAYDFAYSQAPKNMKGLLTALWLVTVAVGNVIVALINLADLGANSYVYFGMAGVMVLVFGVFLLLTRSYVYTQDEKKPLPINDSD